MISEPVEIHQNVSEWTNYDRKGNVISLEEWLSLYLDDSYQILKKDSTDGFLIFTAWAGANLNTDEAIQSPKIFQTMVLSKTLKRQVYKKSYENEEEAFKGHENILNHYAKADYNPD